MNRCDPWGGWEDRLVIDLFPMQGADGVMAQLPHRSSRAVWERARVLGVKRPKPGKWTSVEKGLIADLYPNGGAKAVKPYFPNRTLGEIDRQAKAQGAAPRPELYPMPDECRKLLKALSSWPASPGQLLGRVW